MAPARVNHYIVRSFEEFLIKRDRGRGFLPSSNLTGFATRDLGFFCMHDKISHGDVDTSVTKFAAKIEKEVNALIARCELEEDIDAVFNLVKDRAAHLLRDLRREYHTNQDRKYRRHIARYIESI